MTHNDNNAVLKGSNNPEQLDLIDLLLQLWRGRKTIAMFTVALVLAAVIFIFVAPAKMDINSRDYDAGCGTDHRLHDSDKRT